MFLTDRRMTILSGGRSAFFSPAVGGPANRTVFVQTIANLAGKQEVDGINFERVLPTAGG